MPLTADDVRHKQFNPSRLVRRGYDEAEVDDFLDQVVAALEERDARIGTLAASPPAPVGTAVERTAVAEDPAASSVPEAAAALLALAQRTAEEHIAAGEASAAKALAEAEREANATLAAATAEARRVIEEAEQQRHSILATVYSEQQRVSEAAAAVQDTAQRAHQHLQAYLSGLLRQVQEFPTGQAPPELTAVSA